MSKQPSSDWPNIHNTLQQWHAERDRLYAELSMAQSEVQEAQAAKIRLEMRIQNTTSDLNNSGPHTSPDALAAHDEAQKAHAAVLGDLKEAQRKEAKSRERLDQYDAGRPEVKFSDLTSLGAVLAGLRTERDRINQRLNELEAGDDGSGGDPIQSKLDAATERYSDALAAAELGEAVQGTVKAHAEELSKAEAELENARKLATRREAARNGLTRRLEQISLKIEEAMTVQKGIVGEYAVGLYTGAVETLESLTERPELLSALTNLAAASRLLRATDIKGYVSGTPTIEIIIDGDVRDLRSKTIRPLPGLDDKVDEVLCASGLRAP